MAKMTRGEIAERTGVTRETVRYYEKRGLIPSPARSDGGYRLYGKRYVRRLRFIGRAKQLGFTLEEIKDLLALRADAETTRDDVRAQAEEKLADVNEKITDLKRVRRALTSLTDECAGGPEPTSACSILDALERGAGFQDPMP